VPGNRKVLKLSCILRGCFFVDRRGKKKKNSFEGDVNLNENTEFFLFRLTQLCLNIQTTQGNFSLTNFSSFPNEPKTFNNLCWIVLGMFRRNQKKASNSLEALVFTSSGKLDSNKQWPSVMSARRATYCSIPADVRFQNSQLALTLSSFNADLKLFRTAKITSFLWFSQIYFEYFNLKIGSS